MERFFVCGGFGSPLDISNEIQCKCDRCEWCDIRRCEVAHWGESYELCAGCEEVFLAECNAYHKTKFKKGGKK